jgi:hypothetical protein
MRVHECLRSTDLLRALFLPAPHRLPEEHLAKQRLRFTLMQGNQAC